MGAPLGNKNAVGNKSGGHPTRRETEWHFEKWEKESLIEELKLKIASGCYSIRDRWLLMALEGNQVILKQAADKILANLVDIRGKDGEALQPMKIEGFVYAPLLDIPPATDQEKTD